MCVRKLPSVCIDHPMGVVRSRWVRSPYLLAGWFMDVPGSCMSFAGMSYVCRRDRTAEGLR